MYIDNLLTLKRLLIILVFNTLDYDFLALYLLIFIYICFIMNVCVPPQYFTTLPRVLTSIIFF